VDVSPYIPTPPIDIWVISPFWQTTHEFAMTWLRSAILSYSSKSEYSMNKQQTTTLSDYGPHILMAQVLHVCEPITSKIT
jgi:hypothetical protein